MEETDKQMNPPTEGTAVTGAFAFDDCAQGIFGTHADYTRVNTTNKIVSSNDSTISSLTASRTQFQAHQYVPMVKFFNSVNRRLLIADEVGLGKTIETGHILLELKARNELGNVLIVCPKSLQPKWQIEMMEKFGLVFKIYDKNVDLFHDLQLKDGCVRGLINYEKIRRRRDYDTKQEFETDDPVNLVDYLSQNPTRFSLVVCDEAHRMRNYGTLTYKGAEILMSRADGAVFLTATPMMTWVGNLYNLFRLLDPDRFGDSQLFGSVQQETATFIAAAALVHNGSKFSVIKKWLESREIHITYSDELNNRYLKTETIPQIYSGDAIYNEIIGLLDGEDTPTTRAMLLQRLEAIRGTSDVITRTRKREITTNMSQPERKPHIVSVALTAEESGLAELAIRKYLEDNLSPTRYKPWMTIAELKEQVPGKIRLGLMQIERQLASDVYAYLSEWDLLEKGIDVFSKCVDSKVERVIELIEGRVNAGGERKVVIFSVFRKTLEYLRIRLRKRGYNCFVIHGDVDHRDEVIDHFRKTPNIHVLLASEVVGEGLDLEFCSMMINFDLPWNPMVVEQRIGRLDRFGQKSPVIHIYNMVVAGSIQEDIYNRLWSRIDMFRWNVGQVEQIFDIPMYGFNEIAMNETFEQYESRFYCGELTREEVLRKMDEIAIAIEGQRQRTAQLNDGLEETHTYDSYLQGYLGGLLTNHFTLGGAELRAYFEDVLAVAVPGANLVERGDGTFCLTMPKDDPSALEYFLKDNQPYGIDNEKVYADFIHDVEGKEDIVLTFDQETALANRGMTFVNVFHPLIAACVSYNERSGRTRLETFCFSLPYGPVKGTFYLALYEMTTRRDVQGASRVNTEQIPVLYDIQTGTVVADRTVAESAFRLTYEYAADCKPDEELHDPALLARVRQAVEYHVAQASIAKRKLLTQVAEAAAERRIVRTREYYESIVRNRQRAIELWENVLRYSIILTLKERKCLQGAVQISKTFIRYAKEEMENRLARIRPGVVTVGARLLTLSLIVIEDTLDNRPD